MPELPEVKTIQDQLNTVLPLTIESVSKSSVHKSIVHTPLTKLKNVQIIKAERKGKMLNFLLSDGRHLLSHLGMTGTWLISKEKVTEKHTHVQFKTNKYYIAYVDPRRFGHMYLLKAEDAQVKLNNLGVDLLSKEFTLKYFKQALLRYPNRLIKVTLLDQSLFAGTGNYIANEICAHGGVLPDRAVSSLNTNEFRRLFKGVAKVIHPAVNSGGTTFAGGYRDATGEKGNGVQHLVVFYQKVCQLCKTSDVIKINLAQRGTYYCPSCQK